MSHFDKLHEEGFISSKYSDLFNGTAGISEWRMVGQHGNVKVFSDNISCPIVLYHRIITTESPVVIVGEASSWLRPETWKSEHFEIIPGWVFYGKEAKQRFEELRDKFGEGREMYRFETGGIAAMAGRKLAKGLGANVVHLNADKSDIRAWYAV